MTLTRRVRGRWGLALLVVASVAATGCGGGGGRHPSCGAYEAPIGEITAEQRVIRDCFLTAFDEGREAEVTITARTIEGDAVTTVYRVLAPNQVELLVDASDDTFAAVKTYRQRCTSVAEEGAVLAAAGCTTTG